MKLMNNSLQFTINNQQPILINNIKSGQYKIGVTLWNSKIKISGYVHNKQDAKDDEKEQSQKKAKQVTQV